MVFPSDISRYAAKADSPDKLTKTGATLGTLNYFAPEQAMGLREKISPPTDVWAIGTIVFELLTGECYFPGNDHTVAVRIARGELKPPSSRIEYLSTAFDSWFAHSCALAPEQRFTSVGEQALKLAEAMGIPEDVRLKLADGVAPESLLRWSTERPKTSENETPEPPVDPTAATKMEVSADPKAVTAMPSAVANAAANSPAPASAALGVRSGVRSGVASIVDGERRLSRAGSTTGSAEPVGRLTTFQFALIIAAFAVVAVLALIPISLMRRNAATSGKPERADSGPLLTSAPHDSGATNLDAPKGKPDPVPVPVKDPGPPPVQTPIANAEDASGKSAKNKKKHHPKKVGKGTKPEKPGTFDPEAP